MGTDGSEKGKNEIKGPEVIVCKVCVRINREEVRLQGGLVLETVVFTLRCGKPV